MTRASERTTGQAPAATWRRLGTLALKGVGGEPVDLARTLSSHGVATLAPQRVDPVRKILETTVALAEERALTLRIRSSGSHRVAVETTAHEVCDDDARYLVELARTVLALDEDLSRFYELVGADPALSWAGTGAGRMVRSPTVFEDIVKTICTTNCAWSATIRMVHTMVDQLGAVAPDGRRASPSPEALAKAGEAFFSDVVRAGYRSAYLLGIARRVADGSLEVESLRDRDLLDEEVTERLLGLPGVGPYACAHIMLISLGRYRQLILDSWTRPTYARLVGKKTVTDTAIERRFRRFGDFSGLAFWLFLTRGWVE